MSVMSSVVDVVLLMSGMSSVIDVVANDVPDIQCG